ncbi:hypothetical protein KRE28_16885 [Elizabethkingia meningoseptica]|uniref:hypothetical protein n=1 Tax=Elizabethkingia meningoseptica TaxID=238 RepID=UPI0023B0E4A0|nr:hypothetical protein [Elizabethkingia meningoseptica]MDE5483484.1 hypothetical protein [Elizabethkingia meningoseptica]
MKKLLFVAITTFSVASCGSLNRTFYGTTESTLIKTVAIEQNCPKENIKVVERLKGVHGATYAVEACGKRYVYKQSGSVFVEATRVNEIFGKPQNP